VLVAVPMIQTGMVRGAGVQRSVLVAATLFTMSAVIVTAMVRVAPVVMATRLHPFQSVEE